MTVENILTLSYYKEIADIDTNHNISLVKHCETNQIYVKKIMSIYNKDVYLSLKEQKINGIPHIFEIIEDDNQLITIEEYVSGQTLEEIIESKQHLSFDEITAYLIQLCDILTYLHNLTPAIIHRDIKPSNIIIRPNHTPFLLDFNAAKLDKDKKEEDTRLLGTKGYAAPEQYGFGTSDARTDIFAIGVVFKILLDACLDNHCSMSKEIASIITKCTELDPKNRYQNATELKQALEALLSSSTTKTKQAKPERIYRFLPPGFRRLIPSHMVIGTIIYVLLFYIGLTLPIENASQVEVIICRGITLISFLLIALFTGNYLDCQRFVKLCKNSKKSIFYLGILLGVFIIFSIVFVLGLIILTFID